ncbi:MAG: hypothetical protein C5B43_00050 [Verrucomicrobia bacterium]|nr:MAG: hypothetical protein C5B43_00050 [Verrucomicrobiota bacterium]
MKKNGLIYNQIQKKTMKRLLFIDLKKWRNSLIRKPLLLRGARQVGKTHVIRQLGELFEEFVEINFEKKSGSKKNISIRP